MIFKELIETQHKMFEFHYKKCSSASVKSLLHFFNDDKCEADSWSKVARVEQHLAKLREKRINSLMWYNK